MRVADRPLPPITLDSVTNIADWPIRPVIAIEGRTQPAYVYDDGSTWDDPTPLVWDVATTWPLWADATCTWQGLDYEYGPPDEHGTMPAGRLTVQLDNRDGRWSQYNADGTLTRFAPGLRLYLWAKSATASWWLFAGTIARWDERADNTVEVEAFDAFADLAQLIGTYTAGAGGQLPAARLAAIVNLTAPTLRTAFATGTVALTAQPTEAAPLEEAQTVAASDGGILFTDADGTVTYLARTWRNGRGDQTTIPVVSDNVCTAPLVIWDATISTNDDGLADGVALENVAKLRAVAGSLVGQFTIADTGQQWTSQAEGDTLAAWILSQQSRPRFAVDEFTVYLLAAGMAGAVDWRLFDRLRFVHESATPTGPSVITVETVITGVRGTITPDAWTLTVATSRALQYFAPVLWDTPLYQWDSSDPLAVWGY